MSLSTLIKKVVSLEDLSDEEMSIAMGFIMTGEASPAQIAGFLVALEMKKPTVVELTAAVRVMRHFATRIALDVSPLIDIVGTGGDGLATFNVSTTAMFVVAAAGGKVAKHGNRSASGRCGSADVLERAGINLSLTPTQVKQCIEQIGVSFLFAPTYHPAIKYAALPRKELGIRTFFNLLGPLTNPAGADTLMVGVFDKKWSLLIAQVLLNLQCKRALVVHSQDGLDEISIAANTEVVELRNNEITSYTLSPKDYDLSFQPLAAIQVETVDQSFELMLAVLNNVAPAPAKNIVILNAGAAIYIAGLANTLAQGMVVAAQVLTDGNALNKYQELISFTQNL